MAIEMKDSIWDSLSMATLHLKEGKEKLKTRERQLYEIGTKALAIYDDVFDNLEKVIEEEEKKALEKVEKVGTDFDNVVQARNQKLESMNSKINEMLETYERKMNSVDRSNQAAYKSFVEDYGQ